eukprot:Gregarina_sp_Poly_1__842@NODE_11_length_23386_cov_122_075861_g9_i0_p15_GENE_NODE_11_length_23386_cov_122_075861_g9_i0NODE_11_length_23386_cov_122_075861_g9_i0_p15_ORF_typecomplete_len110_score4_39DUF5042/PF16445_5/0_33_NODE_11_length_23386_cov_122_075861_g9_i01845218781
MNLAKNLVQCTSQVILATCLLISARSQLGLLSFNSHRTIQPSSGDQNRNITGFGGSERRVSDTLPNVMIVLGISAEGARNALLHQLRSQTQILSEGLAAALCMNKCLCP